jgi:hypothetical protein
MTAAIPPIVPGEATYYPHEPKPSSAWSWPAFAVGVLAGFVIGFLF